MAFGICGAAPVSTCKLNEFVLVRVIACLLFFYLYRLAARNGSNHCIGPKKKTDDTACLFFCFFVSLFVRLFICLLACLFVCLIHFPFVSFLISFCFLIDVLINVKILTNILTNIINFISFCMCL